jgi:hypothetical protein
MVDTLTLLDRAPAPFRRFAYRVAAGQGPLGRLADAVRFRYSDADIPDLPQTSTADVRLVIGPANTAGQGYEWARAVERNLPGVDALAMHGVVPDPYQPKVDLSVPMAVYQRSGTWHHRFEEFLATQTHVIFESAFPLLGRHHGSDVLRDIEYLSERGVHSAFLFHGSDIRPPSLHAQQNEWSPFRDPRGPMRALEDSAALNAAVVASAGLPAFVSTPDQLQWLPQATWCPVVVDPAWWRASAGLPRESRRPVVVHAPSSTWLKGTDLIEPMLMRLADEGVIEYRRIVSVPHTSMPDFYAAADIVLDQFRLGSYGVAACEAMASGRLVMSHVDEPTRQAVRQHTGLDLPIHEATVDTLEAELRRAAASPGEFEATRVAGPAFVDAVHDGRYSAAALAPFLGVSA